MTKIKIKTGDQVKVLAGDHKGSEGKVVKLFRSKRLAIVEGVNLVKKHNKPSSENPKGGIIEKEAPLHISNLSLLTSKGETTRVGFKIIDGKKSRIALKSDEII
ncbi:MAG: 50S ribosomal protein L24 [Bacteroidetes bacterium]|jgi:large subunit ribosomal protein L24|nr:MAG: 50S ribosomal protein L24 [Cryomorphaceae bacterium BACL29 MAG-121220-bin8]MDA0757086.1 50S ribosomal protein L24 [Bacteroidota bacterium]MDA1018615.1 50S ribosomal protein L24 [Bacteroidota bacterium]|tara:strand:- start:138125 stop:138436 length:312 start_codon:yes stop_codon:yes gene_type:complete